MTAPEPDGPLTLREALSAWCEPNLILRARHAQQSFTAAGLELAGRPNLGQARLSPGSGGQYRPTSIDEGTQNNEMLWRALLADWRRRVEINEIMLTGVQTAPEVQDGRSHINGLWASDIDFNFINSTATGVGRRFVAVHAWRGRLPQVGVAAKAAPAPLSLEAVRDLDPEVVAAILELHAEHVCADLRVNLNQPGWASIIALVAAKMKRRAARNEMRPKLTEEAAWLAEWAARVAPSYDTPSEKRISNKLGRLYRDLSSTGDVPRPNR